MKIDIGCGNKIEQGYVGVDFIKLPEVEYVCNFDTEPLPFPDNSIDEVFSSHCFEHLKTTNILKELGRVCKDGAKMRLIMPYSWNNDAHIYGHVQMYNETQFLHICKHFPDIWHEQLNSYWLLHNVVYVVPTVTQDHIKAVRVPIAFAILHYVNIVKEIILEIEVKKPDKPAPVETRFWYASGRNGERKVAEYK